MSRPTLRLVKPGEQRPHACAVMSLTAAFLRMNSEQQAAALSTILELAPGAVAYAAGTMTARQPVMVLVAGHQTRTRP